MQGPAVWWRLSRPAVEAGLDQPSLLLDAAHMSRHCPKRSDLNPGLSFQLLLLPPAAAGVVAGGLLLPSLLMAWCIARSGVGPGPCAACIPHQSQGARAGQQKFRANIWLAAKSTEVVHFAPNDAHTPDTLVPATYGQRAAGRGRQQRQKAAVPSAAAMPFGKHVSFHANAQIDVYLWRRQTVNVHSKSYCARASLLPCRRTC